MKIYNTIKEAKESNITTFPGIYYFRNKNNNKYYIGQAINIRKRFNKHCFNIKTENNNYPIYKAIIQYGIENFEFGIICVYKGTEPQEKIKKALDYLEKLYIKKYNSYSEGYNQTLGGDGGILGYKMTEEQKIHISENSKKVAADGRYGIYIYNIKEEKEYFFLNLRIASEYFNVNKDSLRSAMHRNGLYSNNLIVRKTREEIYNFINTTSTIDNIGHRKYSLEEYKELKKQYSTLSLPELAKEIGLCKKTVYNYEHKLNPEKFNKELVKWKITNIKTNESLIVNVYEGAEYFNLQKDTFRSMANKCSRENNLYRKQFKITKL